MVSQQKLGHCNAAGERRVWKKKKLENLEFSLLILSLSSENEKLFFVPPSSTTHRAEKERKREREREKERKKERKANDFLVILKVHFFPIINSTTSNRIVLSSLALNYLISRFFNLLK